MTVGPENKEHCSRLLGTSTITINMPARHTQTIFLPLRSLRADHLRLIRVVNQRMWIQTAQTLTDQVEGDQLILNLVQLFVDVCHRRVKVKLHQLAQAHLSRPFRQVGPRPKPLPLPLLGLSKISCKWENLRPRQVRRKQRQGLTNFLTSKIRGDIGHQYRRLFSKGPTCSSKI